jgi:hypothetical protein
MNININIKAVLVASICAGAILFTLGASNAGSSDGPRWTISATSGTDSGAYILDQKTGDIYFLEKSQNIGTKKMKIKLLGNIQEAK